MFLAAFGSKSSPILYFMKSYSLKGSGRVVKKARFILACRMKLCVFTEYKKWGELELCVLAEWRWGRPLPNAQNETLYSLSTENKVHIWQIHIQSYPMFEFLGLFKTKMGCLAKPVLAKNFYSCLPLRSWKFQRLMVVLFGW